MKFNKNMKTVSLIFFCYALALSVTAFSIFNINNKYFIITYIFTFISFVVIYLASMYYLLQHTNHPDKKASRAYAVMAGQYAILQMGSSLIIIGSYEYFEIMTAQYYLFMELFLLMIFAYKFHRNLFEFR